MLILCSTHGMVSDGSNQVVPLMMLPAGLIVSNIKVCVLDLVQLEDNLEVTF